MTGWHDELVKILEEEEKLLKALYDTVSKERDAIVSLDSQELERILIEKQEILTKLSLWEKEREKLLEKHNLKGTGLEKIIESAEKNSENTLRLRELYKTMKTMLTAITEIQRINEQLIDRSIIHIGTAIKFLETFGINAKQSLSKEA